MTSRNAPTLEEDEQIMLFQWARHYPQLRLLHAIPNGGYRMGRTAGRLKAAGVLSGVPDICLPGAFPLRIEMKRPYMHRRAFGDLSDTQRRVIPLLAEDEAVFIAYGFDAARAILQPVVKQGKATYPPGTVHQAWTESNALRTQACPENWWLPWESA